MSNQLGRGLDAGDDASMIVEIWTVLLVIFLLLFVLMAGVRVEHPREVSNASASNELSAVVEGTPAPGQLVLVSDGRMLFTTSGEALRPAALSQYLEPVHRSISVVVPATLRVVDLDRLREAIGKDIGAPVRFGQLPDEWLERVREWGAR